MYPSGLVAVRGFDAEDRGRAVRRAGVRGLPTGSGSGTRRAAAGALAIARGDGGGERTLRESSESGFERPL